MEANKDGLAEEANGTDKNDQQRESECITTFGRIHKVVRQSGTIAVQVINRHRRRKTESELWRADWEDMFWFNQDRYGPDFEKYGSEMDGARRRSKRIAGMKLVTYK